MSRSLNPNLFGAHPGPAVKTEINNEQVKKIRELETQAEVTNQKLERWAQMLEQRFQHLHNGQKVLSEQMKSMLEGWNKQQANIFSKMNERRVSDAKIQELVDRHNQLVNSFETRIAQIQKVSAEQEMKLMTYQATYDEILREIRNLKA